MDPYDETKMGMKLPQQEADIVTISHEHDDHNARLVATGTPLILDIPGEYEKNGIRISGFETYHDKQQGAQRGKNTMFKVEMDELAILHCGDLGHTLSSELIEEIDGVDILLIPVGGFYTIDASEARQMVEKLEPSLVIPMHYKDPQIKPNIDNYADMAPVEDFLGKVGVSDPERVKTLSIKKSDLTETVKIMVMDKS